MSCLPFMLAQPALMNANRELRLQQLAEQPVSQR